MTTASDYAATRTQRGGRYTVVVIIPTMAYVIARPNNRWEVRESHATPMGPRSKTLATFSNLTPEAIKHALSRSSGNLQPSDIIHAALSAGAPITQPTVSRAARELLVELTQGRHPSRTLSRLLLDALGDRQSELSDSARAAAEWVAASPLERGAALRDLLLLADRLPQGSHSPLEFPRINSEHR